MTYPLLYPVQLPTGETVAILELRRPTVRDLKAMDSAKGEIDKIATMLRQIAVDSATGKPLTTTAVELIDAEDFTRLGEVVAGFFEASPPTGTI